MARGRKQKESQNASTEAKFSTRLGSRLREVRRQRGLALTDVERISGGEFKSSVLGAYERGERAVSVPRLARLAELYGVTVEELLPSEDRQQRPPAMTPSASANLVIDLEALDNSDVPEAEVISRYLSRIRSDRGAWGDSRLAIRRDDVHIIAAFVGTSEEDLLSRLYDLGIAVPADEVERERASLDKAGG
jgi:transcriptional regulator with XRE-family HTH domain